MKYLILAVGVLFALSCQKEYSIENGLGLDAKPEGCLVASIERKIGDQSMGVIHILHNDNFTVSQIADTDGNNQVFDQIDFTYEANNEVGVNASESYILDPVAFFRVKEYHFKDIDDGGTPGDPSDDIVINHVYIYNYDAAGYLVSKVWIEADMEVVRYDYTWTNGNLTKIIGKLAPTGDVFFTVNLTYITDLKVKDFLNLQWEEIPSLVTLGLNLGKKSTNAVKTIEVNGNLTTFSNYVVNPESQITSFETDEDFLAGYGIYRGTNELQYMCP